MDFLFLWKIILTNYDSIYIIISERRDTMKNKIVVYGGSFNPPLNSHFSIAQQVINQIDNVEKVIFVPVNANYLKKGLVSNEDRLKMLSLVIDKNDQFELSDMNMNVERSLYMIEILDKMQNQYPDKEICFVMGSDNLKEVEQWKNAKELLTQYPLIVMERDTDEAFKIIQEREFLKKFQDTIYLLNQDIKSNYSSTYVREQIKNGKSVRYLMPDEVYEYIKEHELYR